jgi:hypothetical protein
MINDETPPRSPGNPNILSTSITGLSDKAANKRLITCQIENSPPTINKETEFTTIPEQFFIYLKINFERFIMYGGVFEIHEEFL